MSQRSGVAAALPPIKSPLSGYRDKPGETEMLRVGLAFAGPARRAAIEARIAALLGETPDPERAAVADPEPKPPEADSRAVEGAGSSSETHARLSAPAAGRPGGPVCQDDTGKAGRAGGAGGSPAADTAATDAPAEGESDDVVQPHDQRSRAAPNRAPVDIAELRRLAELGLGITEICVRLRKSDATVRRLAGEHGIAVRDNRGGRRDQRDFWLTHDAELRRLAESGVTATAAAAALGITKSAAIGRAYRLGLEWAGSPEPRPAAAPRCDPFAAGGCLWPIGDPGEADFGFCGAAAEGGPYCAVHRQRAYLPRPQRQTGEKSIDYLAGFAARRGG